VASVMDDEMQKFYINGIYFREDTIVSEFIKYSKWLKKHTAENFEKSTVNYALFEILAEYKRRGISKLELLKALMTFNPFFIIKEVLRRKKSAKSDVTKCIEVADKMGLVRTAGSNEFPIFEKL
jgi:hypothetical protein